MNSSVGVGARLGVVASVLLVAAGVLAVAPAADAAAGRLTPAQIRQLLRPAQGMQAFPPVSLARRIQASIGPNTVGNMTYHGGPVMQQKNDSVPIFWMPATVQDGSSATPSANYVSLVERYFDDIGGSPLNQIATQYYQTVNGPTEYIVNSSQRVLAVVDTSAYPTAGAGCSGNGVDCVDDSQVRSEVLAVSSAHSLAQNINTEYYVFLAPHETTCFNSTDCFKADNATSSNFQFCAYHDSFQNSGNEVVYANMPYGSLASGSDCSTLSSFPNDHDADIVISTTSHEQLESTTDPNTNAWYFQTISGEIGDECAYNYGTMGLDGGLANEQWNGHYYAVQQEWSNAITGCSPGVSSSPANDNFASAQALTGTADTSGTTNGSTVGATKETGEPTPIGNAGGHSIWYSITPASSGQLRVDTCGSGFDTLLGVYTGSAVNALTTQADNDDSCGQQSSVQLAVTGGTKYSIEVDGYSGDSGAVTLNWWLATNDRIVSVSWSTSEATRLATMGVSLGPIPAAQVQRTSTYIISYILGFVSPTPTPVTLPAPGNAVTYTDLWTPSEFAVIDRVKHKYTLNDSDATRFSTKIIDYLLALGGH